MGSTGSSTSGSAAGAISLERRFAWATAARLTLISLLFIAILVVNVRGEPTLNSYTVVVGLWVLGIAFALSGVYAWFLRQKKHLTHLVSVQLVLDQAVWSCLVYLSGGVTSGATSFYGVTCFFGAILAGFRGAALAAVSGGICFVSLEIALLNEWIIPPPDQPREVYAVGVEEAVYSGGLNILVLILVALLAGNLAERLRAAGGQVVRVEQKLAQAEREAALGRLATALAHEIRNPLGSIAGSVRLLSENPDLGEDDQQLCEIIYRESRRLDELVSDMLNLAKPRKAERVGVEVVAVAREVVDLAAHSGRGVNDVSIVYRGLDELVITADPALFRQMLWNLVRNAVQASNPSQTVVVSLTESDGGATIRVEDRGPGMSDEAKAHLFDAFFTTRSHGTGIGLAVVKRIADEHDWEVGVEDTEGGGATFWVRLGESTPEATIGEAPAAAKPWTLFPKAGP